MTVSAFIFEKTKLTQIRVNQAIWDAIPAPKAAWVREAIVEKAKKEAEEIFYRQMTEFVEIKKFDVSKKGKKN